MLVIVKLPEGICIYNIYIYYIIYMHILGIYIPNFMDWSNWSSSPHFWAIDQTEMTMAQMAHMKIWRNHPQMDREGVFDWKNMGISVFYDILPMKMWGAKPIIMGIQLEIYEDIRGYVRIHQFDIRQKLDHPKQQFIWESWWNSPKELWNIYEYPLVNEHNYGKSPLLMGKLTINGNFQ